MSAVTANKCLGDETFSSRNVTDDKRASRAPFVTRNGERTCLATPPCTCKRGNHLVSEGEPVWFAFIRYGGMFAVSRQHGMVCREHMREAEIENDWKQWWSSDCDTCQRTVWLPSTGRDRYRRHAFCSERCESLHYSRIQRERRLEARQKECETCGQEFIGGRRDAKTCSSACRQKAYRQRVATGCVPE